MSQPFAQKLSEFLAGGVVMALGLYILVEAQGFPTLPGNDYGASLFPAIIGTGMTLGGAWLLLVNIRPLWLGWAGRQRVPAARLLAHGARLAIPVVLVCAYLWLADVLGSILTLVLIVAVLMKIGGVRLIPACLISVVTAAVIWFAFVHMLKVPLPQGILGV